jgi:hypothetical protein
MPNSTLWFIRSPFPFSTPPAPAFVRSYARNILQQLNPDSDIACIDHLRISIDLLPPPQPQSRWHNLRFSGPDLAILLTNFPQLRSSTVTCPKITWFESLPCTARPTITVTASTADSPLRPQSQSHALATSSLKPASTTDGFTLVTARRRRRVDTHALPQISVSNRFTALSVDSDTESQTSDDFFDNFALLAADIASDLNNSLQFRRWLFMQLQSKHVQFARLGMALAKYDFISAD